MAFTTAFSLHCSTTALDGLKEDLCSDSISSLSIAVEQSRGLASSSVLSTVYSTLFSLFFFFFFLPFATFRLGASPNGSPVPVSPCVRLCFGAAEASVLAPSPLVEQTSLITILGTSLGCGWVDPKAAVGAGFDFSLSIRSWISWGIFLGAGPIAAAFSPATSASASPADLDSGDSAEPPAGLSDAKEGSGLASTEASAPSGSTLGTASVSTTKLSRQAVIVSRVLGRSASAGDLIPHLAMHSKLGIE
mmetsp:Transcript_8441/g.30464  ORF Transcript_8441/g.30464 Transcript_8441/m.30464 type:complete len:248 (-) Transcript_8441:402-1145(-)